MAKRLWIIPLAALVVAGLACDTSGPSQPPTPTLFVLPSLASTSVPPTCCAATEPPTEATAEPTQGAPSMVAPTALVQQTPGAGVDRVEIYLIALEDDGKSGDPVGCGDSVVPVERLIAPTLAPLRAAMEQLVAVKDQFLSDSGLYNSLHDNQFTVGKVDIDASGVATIELTGAFALGGECDGPRFEAQLMHTALQFSTLTDAHIFINGKLLQDMIKLNP